MNIQWLLSAPQQADWSIRPPYGEKQMNIIWPGPKQTTDGNSGFFGNLLAKVTTQRNKHTVTYQTDTWKFRVTAIDWERKVDNKQLIVAYRPISS